MRSNPEFLYQRSTAIYLEIRFVIQSQIMVSDNDWFSGIPLSRNQDFAFGCLDEFFVNLLTRQWISQTSG